MNDIFRKYGAKAIWMDENDYNNRYVRFQSEFDVKEGEKTTLFFCSDTNYELYVNGNLAGFGQYHDFPKDKKYDELDITPFLKKGNNLLSILGYSQNRDSAFTLAGLPAVIFTVVAGEKCLVKSDETVKCDDVPEIRYGEDVEKISNERPFSIGFDLRKYDGWRETAVSENWENSVIRDNSEIQYSPRPVDKIVLGEFLGGRITCHGTFSMTENESPSEEMQFASLTYVEKDKVINDEGEAVELLADNVFWIADLGEEMAGYYFFDIEAEEGAVFDIAIGEHLRNLRVRSFARGRRYGIRFIAKGGRQRFAFYTHRWAGRYIQVFAHKGVKKVYGAGLHKTRYPFKFKSTIDTKDRLLNKICEVAQRTLDVCVHEHYEDCPLREQALYGFDGRNQMLAGYYAFGETDMPRESLRLLAKTQTPDGLIEITAPTTAPFTMPIFSLAWVSALREYILFSGDKEFGKEMFDCAQKIVRFFELDKNTNLIKRPQSKRYWNYYEWTDNLGGWEEIGDVKADALLNGFMACVLKDYKDICEWTGQSEEKEWAEAEHNAIKSAFHNTFYNEEKRAYIAFTGANVAQYSQLTQAWALYGDVVPKEYQSVIRETLASDTLGEVSLSHTFFKYEALLQESEKYAEYVLNDMEKLWGNMLYNGATTFWETALADDDFRMVGASSYCHGWAAMPLYILWKYMAGVYPEKPGFSEIKLNPVLGDNLVEGVIKTPTGVYKIKSGRGVKDVEKL